MKRMRLVGIALGAAFCCLCGCGKKEEDVSIRYLNFKPEVADVWEEIAQTYEKETGVHVDVIHAPSNSNTQTLKAEIAKRETPTLFQISGQSDYKNWNHYCVDLSDTDLYSWVIDKDMVIKDEKGSGVYGIPYVVEGYGIIYNDEIMQRYFALPDRRTNVSSMQEVNNFDKLKAVTEEMTERKAELGIEGVFAGTSLGTGEEWRWQTHLLNLPIYYEYRDKNVDDLEEMEFKYLPNFKNIFDLYVDNSCCDKSKLMTEKVVDSMQEFATGKCAMVQNGNWGWTQIADAEGNVVKEENCKFLPIYTGVEGEEDQGICIGTECYICVNALASEKQQQESIRFLEWLYSSDTGKDYVTNKLQFITVFNTFSDAELPKNPLAEQVVEYMNREDLHSVSWNFTTFPSQSFKDQVASDLKKYIGGEMEMEEFTRSLIEKWKSEKTK